MKLSVTLPDNINDIITSVFSQYQVIHKYCSTYLEGIDNSLGSYEKDLP